MGVKTENRVLEAEKRTFESLLQRLSDLNTEADEVSLLAEGKANELMGSTPPKESDSPESGSTNGILDACFESVQRLKLRLRDIREQISRL